MNRTGSEKSPPPAGLSARQIASVAKELAIARTKPPLFPGRTSNRASRLERGSTSFTGCPANPTYQRADSFLRGARNKCPGHRASSGSPSWEARRKSDAAARRPRRRQHRDPSRFGLKPCRTRAICRRASAAARCPRPAGAAPSIAAAGRSPDRFDGNWHGDDNWDSTPTGSSQAYVYYAVMETATHWFLVYNFFHPRDYDDRCIAGTCHQNDNEGLVLTVRKDGSRFGRLQVMETLAHNRIFSYRVLSGGPPDAGWIASLRRGH